MILIKRIPSVDVSSQRVSLVQNVKARMFAVSE